MSALDIVLACVDVGKQPGWCIRRRRGGRVGSSLGVLVRMLARDLRAGRPVALGFECPMYVPRRVNPDAALKARVGERSRPWCIHAGAGALVAGLGQADAVLAALKDACGTTRGTTRWSEFTAGRAPLLVWEAFVTGQKGPASIMPPEAAMCANSHERDALAACAEFGRRMDGGEMTSDLGSEPSLSLARLQLIANGLSEDKTLLTEPCIVVKARKPG